MKIYAILFALGLFSNYYFQTDTIKYPWPTPPFNSSRGLTGSFGEFRNTGSSDHFHNAVDIGEPDGNPVYPCINGEVYYFSNNGYDSYINVKTEINNQKKHITYYHVVPSPSISIGQEVIAGETIIGTIYVGAAHVHLIERELVPVSSTNIGNEINPVRPEGGLYPFYDSFAPSISSSSLAFYRDNSSVSLPRNELTGKVDIRIDVREISGSSYSFGNNGTYILGYRILSGDGNTLVYEPDDQGIKYRFYFLPSNGYVHSVYVKNVATLSDPIYWLTNGNGESQVNTTFSVPNNYLDTDLLDEGSYLLEIFSEDTRENSTSKRFNFSVVKLPPELITVVSRNDSIYISWADYKLNNLKGYRLYYADDRSLVSWEIAADEAELTNDITKRAFGSPQEFKVPSSGNNFYFYLTAVGENGAESRQSDIYSASINGPDEKSALIVDGFDLYGGKGSWKDSRHDFNKIYFDALIDNAPLNISSSSNEAVIDKEIDLKSYDFVFWFVGDESLVNNTFVTVEQAKLAMYLESGGNVFVSGEDIGLDLDRKHSQTESSDTLFYRHYLKSKLMHDGLDLLFEVNGQEGTQFSSMNIQFGEIYPVERPDDIEPINGAHSILNYTYERDGTFRKGGIAYNGTFGSGSELGSVVYLSFPFETIASENIRTELFGGILSYFENGPVKADLDKPGIINNFSLSQNFPNPFNPTTTIKYSIPSASVASNPSGVKSTQNGNINTNSYVSVKLLVYDVLGRKVKTLVNKKQGPGNYEVTFDAHSLSSGIYYYRIITENYSQTKKMALLK